VAAEILGNGNWSRLAGSPSHGDMDALFSRPGPDQG
jgi:hypothetical protein